MGELRAALDRLTDALPERVDGPARLWVDRVFTIRGAGTVVTGTLTSGRLRVEDELEVRPSGASVRIRGLQSMKSQIASATAVARVAVNLRGVKADEIRRGDALTAAGQWADVAVADVRLAREGEMPVPREVVLHVGSAAVPVRVRHLGQDVARLMLAAPLPLHIGDRGLLRDPGAGRVVTGVVVLDPMPPPLRRRGAARLRAAELATASERPDLAAEVRRRGAVLRSDLVTAGVPVGVPGEQPSVVSVGNWLVDGGRWQSWRQRLVAAVDQWAARDPLAPGMPRRSAAAALEMPDVTMVDAVAHEVPDLVIEGSVVRRRDAAPALPPEITRELEALASRLAAEPFDAPEAAELAAAGLTERYLAIAVHDGLLIRLAAGIYLRPESLDLAAARLLAIEQPFTLSQARVALGTTRRTAVPLLELMDRTRRTVRVDSDHRRVRG
jgi:selenocysteine-specific elongation factor